MSGWKCALCLAGDDITEEEIDDMIAETDTDGSGTVDYEGNVL